MDNFASSTKLQVVAMAALCVVLGAMKDTRLLLISDYGHVLDIVFQSMQFYPSEVQLQRYACALLALLIAEGKDVHMNGRVKERTRGGGKEGGGGGGGVRGSKRRGRKREMGSGERLRRKGRREVRERYYFVLL